MQRGISLEISPLFLDHTFVHQGGVNFNEEEDERCPKTSHLTLDGVFKAPMDSEEGERRVKPTKKTKMVETEAENINQSSTVASSEGDNSEKGWI